MENIQKDIHASSEDMLKTYAPKTWKQFRKSIGQNCSYNGEDLHDSLKIIYIQYTNHGMYYRGDWAKEAGVETINNFEDLGTYFQWVKRQSA